MLETEETVSDNTQEQKDLENRMPRLGGSPLNC